MRMLPVLKGADALPEELVPPEEAHHRTLSRDVAFAAHEPPAAMSAMDGYAVRAADAVVTARLKVIGEVAAGRPFSGALAAGEAARIFTGGVVPDGCRYRRDPGRHRARGRPCHDQRSH